MCAAKWIHRRQRKNVDSCAGCVQQRNKLLSGRSLTPRIALPLLRQMTSYPVRHTDRLLSDFRFAIATENARLMRSDCDDDFAVAGDRTRRKKFLKCTAAHCCRLWQTSRRCIDEFSRNGREQQGTRNTDWISVVYWTEYAIMRACADYFVLFILAKRVITSCRLIAKSICRMIMMMMITMTTTTTTIIIILIILEIKPFLFSRSFPS